MLRVRPAILSDVALLRSMIRELAEFEHKLEFVTIRAEDLARDGFNDNPLFRALIAEWDGQPAGYAFFFGSYSTWAGRGIGKVLLAAVARIALDEHCYGIHWEVLNWNEKAIELYTELGAIFRDEWRAVLLTDDALRRLAEKAS